MTNVCRLCLSSNMLLDLFQLDGATNLLFKTVTCINIEIHPSDGLPTMICKPCKNKISKFYKFKKVCLEVDVKLRAKLDLFTNKNNAKNISRVTATTASGPYSTLDSINNNKLCTEEPLKKLHSFTKSTVESDITIGSEKIYDIEFQCEVCGRLFKTRSSLENHLIAHTGLKNFACNLCSKRFCRSENLTNHIRSHLGIKPYICDICGIQSPIRQSLIRHMKIHSSNKDYACPSCNRRFKRSGDLKSHIRTHTGVRPYSCKNCDKTYTSSSGLKKHYKLYCNKEQMLDGK